MELNPKVIFFDLDETLVHKFFIENISQSDIDALKELQKKNIYVVLATGRSEKDTLEAQKLIRINSYGDYIITENGAKIIKYDNQVLQQNHLNEKDFNSIIDFGIKNKLVIKVSNSDHLYTNDFIFRKLAPRFSKRFTFSKYDDMSLGNFKEENLAKVGFFFWSKNKAEKYINKIQETFPDVEVVLTGSGYYIEVTKKSISKLSGAKCVLENINLGFEDAMAFGDSLNDLELFKSVKTSVAMKNSMKELFEYSTYTTSSVEESGVSEFLNKYVLKKELP